MRKLRVYLDTSVISHLMQEDVPEKMADTRELWELFRQGEYDIYLSSVTMEEIDRCPEPKRGFLLEYLHEIKYTLLPVVDETTAVARKIVDAGIMANKNFDDCRHIAAAITGGCHCIASWNFKHLVNVRTIRGARAIAIMEGYHAIDIVSPRSLLRGEYV